MERMGTQTRRMGCHRRRRILTQWEVSNDSDYRIQCWEEEGKAGQDRDQRMNNIRILVRTLMHRDRRMGY